MSREEKRTWWKPGDVALVTWDNASRARKELGDRDRITKGESAREPRVGL